MYSLPTAPGSVGGVLEDALRLYRASFSRCWALSLVAAGLSAWVGRYQSRALGELTSLSPADLLALPPEELVVALTGRVHDVLHSSGLWLSSLAMLLVWLLICTALIVRQHATAVRRPMSTGAALAFALRRAPSMLSAAAISTLLTAAGVLLLIIPGLWVGGMLQLWLVPLGIEEVGPLQALARSWRLVEGHWWFTSTVVGVALTVAALLSMAASLASDLLGALLTVFTVPLLTAVLLAVYYDLKLRREGSSGARALQRA
jgi:hypothetical protein